MKWPSLIPSTTNRHTGLNGSMELRDLWQTRGKFDIIIGQVLNG